MPISILDAAKSKGSENDPEAVGLPMFAGCQHCGASLAYYNSYPTKSGYISCRDCVGDTGFETVEEFDQFQATLEED
jgi:hypothetical protein